MKTLYRVEVIVYEIEQTDVGVNPDGHGGLEPDEETTDVVFEEVVEEFADVHRAQMFATALWKGATK